jgi:hypothetical protein
MHPRRRKPRWQIQERPQRPRELQGGPSVRREVICLQKVYFDCSCTASGVQNAKAFKISAPIISRELLTNSSDMRFAD